MYKVRSMPIAPTIGKDLDTCYSTAYMSQTHDRQYLTISEVAADWHQPMVPQRIMWLSIARADGQLDPPFLQRDAMHKRGLCSHAVSVRLSVRHVRGSRQNE